MDFLIRRFAVSIRPQRAVVRPVPRGRIAECRRIFRPVNLRCKDACKGIEDAKCFVNNGGEDAKCDKFNRVEDLMISSPLI
jgi:hypothetical protein